MKLKCYSFDLRVCLYPTSSRRYSILIVNVEEPILQFFFPYVIHGSLDPECNKNFLFRASPGRSLKCAYVPGIERDNARNSSHEKDSEVSVSKSLTAGFILTFLGYGFTGSIMELKANDSTGSQTNKQLTSNKYRLAAIHVYIYTSILFCCCCCSSVYYP